MDKENADPENETAHLTQEATNQSTPEKALTEEEGAGQRRKPKSEVRKPKSTI